MSNNFEFSTPEIRKIYDLVREYFPKQKQNEIDKSRCIRELDSIDRDDLLMFLGGADPDLTRAFDAVKSWTET
jgi:hypothetical protein